MNNSELYKKSGIVVDDNWFQEATESSEDTVREFLELSKEQCKDKNYTEKEKQKQVKTKENDIEASSEYDSDHYSEIDVNDHVGNIDTLVLMMLILTISMTKFSLLHQAKANIH